jgi:hypothetical protein
MADKTIAFDVHAKQDGIAIAIGHSRDNSQKIAGRLALCPQFLSRARIESNAAGLHCPGAGFSIHEANHQDIACGIVLHYCWNQAIHFVKINLHLALVFRLAHKQKPADLRLGGPSILMIALN